MAGLPIGLVAEDAQSGRSDTDIGWAYMITNLVNGKRYIGIARKPQRRWMQHKRVARSPNPTQMLHRAMAKYGAENFAFEVVAGTKGYQDLFDLERMLIVQHCTFSAYGLGYNVTAGGEGIWGFRFTAASRAKMSDAKKGKKFGPMSEDQKKKLSIANSGKLRSDAAKQNMSIAKLGTKRSPESIEKAANSLRGKPKSEQHKAKMLESLPKAWAARKAALTGVPRTPETKAKISASNKGQKQTEACILASRAAWPKGEAKHTPEAILKISEASRKMWAARKAAQLVAS